MRKQKAKELPFTEVKSQIRNDIFRSKQPNKIQKQFITSGEHQLKPDNNLAFIKEK